MRKVKGGGVVACRTIVSAPVPFLFLWTLDFGFRTWILDWTWAWQYQVISGLLKTCFIMKASLIKDLYVQCSKGNCVVSKEDHHLFYVTRLKLRIDTSRSSVSGCFRETCPWTYQEFVLYERGKEGLLVLLKQELLMRPQRWNSLYNSKRINSDLFNKDRIC